MNIGKGMDFFDASPMLEVVLINGDCKYMHERTRNSNDSHMMRDIEIYRNKIHICIDE